MPVESSLATNEGKSMTQGTTTKAPSTRALGHSSHVALTGPPRLTGGYIPIRTVELSMAWGLLMAGDLKPIDVRTWLSVLEMRERRKHIGKGRKAQYPLTELQRLTGGGVASLKSSLRRLRSSNLVRWSPTTPSVATSPDELTTGSLEDVWSVYHSMPKSRKIVPVPRRVLRLLAGGVTRSVLATTLAQLTCCLFYHKTSGWNPTGSCKASWIAKTFGISKRGVSRARLHLVELGLLAPKDSPGQWHLNRYGSTFSVNLSWSQAQTQAVPSAVGEGTGPSKEQSSPMELSTGRETPQSFSTAKVSTPNPGFGSRLSTPIKTNASSNEELKNHKPRSAGPNGVCKEQGGKLPKPNLRKVIKQDLSSIPRLLELFEQAKAQGLVRNGHLHQLNFIAAAEHARVRGSSNPPGLFMHLVRKKLWHFITEADEDAVRAKLSQHLYGFSEMERPRSSTPIDEDDWNVDEINLSTVFDLFE